MINQWAFPFGRGQMISQAVAESKKEGVMSNRNTSNLRDIVNIPAWPPIPFPLKEGMRNRILLVFFALLFASTVGSPADIVIVIRGSTPDPKLATVKTFDEIEYNAASVTVKTDQKKLPPIQKKDILQIVEIPELRSSIPITRFTTALTSGGGGSRTAPGPVVL